jgi:hypothetical protein
MTRTGLELERYVNKSVYVVDEDLVGLEDVVDQHGAELAQWRVAEELGPCTLALCAVALYFRGLRGGRDGCGLQLSVAAWARVLGRSERAVQYAIRAGVERGFLAWRHRFVPWAWVDDAGIRRQRVQVCSALYLTAYGARRLERRGETRRQWVRWGSTRAGLVVVGVAEKLLATLRSKIRTIALRVTDAQERCTPSFAATPREENLFRSVVRRLVGNAGPAPPAKVSPSGTASPGALLPPNAPPSSSALPGGSEGGEVQSPHHKAALELERQLADFWERRALTPATAWPELWSSSDERGRQFLTREFARWRPYLAELLEAESADRQGRPFQRRLL